MKKFITKRVHSGQQGAPVDFRSNSNRSLFVNFICRI